MQDVPLRPVERGAEHRARERRGDVGEDVANVRPRPGFAGGDVRLEGARRGPRLQEPQRAAGAGPLDVEGAAGEPLEAVDAVGQLAREAVVEDAAVLAVRRERDASEALVAERDRVRLRRRRSALHPPVRAGAAHDERLGRRLAVHCRLAEPDDGLDDHPIAARAERDARALARDHLLDDHAARAGGRREAELPAIGARATGQGRCGHPADRVLKPFEPDPQQRVVDAGEAGIARVLVTRGAPHGEQVAAAALECRFEPPDLLARRAGQHDPRRRHGQARAHDELQPPGLAAGRGRRQGLRIEA